MTRRDGTAILLVCLALFSMYSLFIPQFVAVRELNGRLMDLEARVPQLQKDMGDLHEDILMLYELTDNALKDIWHEIDKWSWVELTVTAYAPHDNVSGICADDNPNSTATGTVPQHGTVAVNPAVIPYGTQMYIPGYGWGTAEDTGSQIRRRTDLIDIYMPTYAEAMQWGRQRLMVLIREGVDN